MNLRRDTPRMLPILAGLALLAPAGWAGQEPTFTAETFGRSTGDVPMRGLGLVLELVQTDPGEPRLRLFGGAPGHLATVLLARDRREAPLAGLRQTELLIGPNVQAIQGIFDWSGTFEVPLDGAASLPEDASIYAQGMHTGLLQLAGGPLVQASHGIAIQRRESDDKPLWFDDLLPHLPEERELGAFTDLAGLLQTALDSAGDSLRLSIELDGSVGLGIEIVDAKVGAKVAAEFTVTRTEDGLYEAQVGSEVAGLAGVGAGFGAEVGLEGSGGYGATMTYRFHSAPGAARGILGMTVALAFPNASPGADWMESGFVGEAGQRMAELQATLNSLGEKADELEQFLWTVLDARVVDAQAFQNKALAGLSAAKQSLAAAAWHQKPARLIQVGIQQGLVAVATGTLNVARAARIHGEAAVDMVRATIDAKRVELSNLVEGLARAGRIACAIAQLRPYTVGHYVGEEFAIASALEAEAKIGVPVVDIKGLESGVTSELKRTFKVRIERKTATQPLRLSVLGTLERETEVVLAVFGSAEAKRGRTIELSQTFERQASGWKAAGASLSLGMDTQAVAGVGCLVLKEHGVGRAWTVSLSDAMFCTQGLAALGSMEALIARIGTMETGLELQDRRQTNLDFAFAIDVNGTGGGIEIEAEWADQGRLMSRSTSVAEGIEMVLDGAGQMIDAAQGTVTALN